METIERMCEIIDDELRKISDKGLNSNNLETAYKLIDMYKDIKNTDYWEKKSEYYMAVLDEMESGGYSQDGGYSQNGGNSSSGSYSMSSNSGGYSSRGRNGSGRYSRSDGGYSGSYDGGSSGARRGQHYVRGHYSRNSGNSNSSGGYSRAGDPYEDYMEQKQSYRSSGKSEDCKQRMLAALEEHMDALTEEINSMSADADCSEERQVVSRFIDKLKRMQ